MLKYLRNPDLGQNVTLFVFLLASAGLSGYCGYKLAEGQIQIIQWVSCALMAFIPFGLSDSLIRRERYEISRDGKGYLDARRAVWFFLLANIVTDFGAGVTIRDLRSVAAGNANTTATNARTALKDAKARIATLTTNGDTKIKFLKASGYTGLINAKKEEMRQEALRGCRKPPCRGAGYLADARELAALKANEATAIELEQLYASIPKLTEAVAENGVTSDTALAPIIALAKLFTVDLNATSETSSVKWGQLLFVLFITSVVNAGIYYKSADAGRRMGPMVAPKPYEERSEPENWWIEDQRPAKSSEPIALKAEPIPTTVTSATLNSDPESWRESMEALDRILARVKAKKQASV